MQELIALVVGLITGTISGIIPGIHSNTIAQFFDSVISDPAFLGIAIISATSVYTVLSLLPSIFLCIPDSSTILSVLPGQRMLKEGKGLQAVNICAFSTIAALLISLALIPLFTFIIPSFYSVVRPVMAPALTIICAALILQEKKINKITGALLIFCLSGVFGLLLLSKPILQEPLFTSFIGLFALSNLITTAKNIELPKQSPPNKSPVFEFLPIILAGVLLGSVADIFPALGSSAQMATFGTILTGADSGKFLSLTTSVGISHTFSSIISLYTINKARTGSVAIIKESIGVPEFNTLILYFIVAVVSIAISVVLLLFLSKYFIKLVNSVNHKILNTILCLYLIAAILLVDGLAGLFVGIVATAIGILPIILGVRRTHVMGFLLVPALIYLW